MHITLKIVYWFIFAIFIIPTKGAYAMKRAREEEIVPLSVDHNPGFYIPLDVVKLILNNLSIRAMALSFVNKEWLSLFKIKFAEFYDFHDTYHKSMVDFKNDKDPFLILQDLRSRWAILMLKLAPEEAAWLAQNFLSKNCTTIKETLRIQKDARWLCATKFKARPALWLQLALLRIGESIPPIDKATPLACGYNTDCLKMLAPAKKLAKYFNKEPNTETKVNLARELCERGLVHAEEVLNIANEIYGDDPHLSLRLTNIALEKDYPFNNDYYLQAAEDNFVGENYDLGKKFLNKILKTKMTISEAENFLMVVGLYCRNFLDTQVLNVHNHIVLGHAYFESPNLAEAWSFFKMAWDKDPEAFTPHDYLVLADIHYLNAEWRKAIDCYKFVLQNEPNILNELSHERLEQAYKNLEDE